MKNPAVSSPLKNKVTQAPDKDVSLVLVSYVHLFPIIVVTVPYLFSFSRILEEIPHISNKWSQFNVRNNIYSERFFFWTSPRRKCLFMHVTYD